MTTDERIDAAIEELANLAIRPNWGWFASEPAVRAILHKLVEDALEEARGAEETQLEDAHAELLRHEGDWGGRDPWENKP